MENDTKNRNHRPPTPIANTSDFVMIIDVDSIRIYNDVSDHLADRGYIRFCEYYLIRRKRFDLRSKMIQNSEPQTVRIKNRKPVSNAKRIVKLLLILITTAAIIGGGLFICCYSTSYTIRDTIGAIVTQSDKPEKAFPGQNQINILLMGRDLDRNDHGQVVKTRGRTDCMMLAHIDFKNHSANILSIPRDTLVRIPGYRGKRRVSYAHQYGGPDLAVETIEGFLGIKPDYYMMLNFDGFARAIDKIGGLQVVVDKKLDYDDNWGNLHIHLNPGKQVVNGTQAIGFARYRKSNDGTGDSDLVRIERQQQLLSALKSKMHRPGVVMKIPSVVDTIRNDMEGNLTSAQIVCLAGFMKSLPKSSSIQMQTIPTEDDGGVYVHADADATKELVDRVFLNNQQ